MRSYNTANLMIVGNAQYIEYGFQSKSLSNQIPSILKLYTL